MATTNQAPAGASAGKPLPFTIGEITKAEPPSGAETKNWYRYTITRGSQRADQLLPVQEPASLVRQALLLADLGR